MHKEHKAKEQGFGQTLREDFQRGGLHKDLWQDISEVMEFFLTEERRRQFEHMNPVKKVFVLPFWLFRALIFKLTPARRILLIIGSVLLVVSPANSSGEAQNWHLLGGLTLVFILLLELKDKLLARDELEAGRVVQAALMPDATPDFPGWDIWIHTQPANDVGGDLVDYLATGDGRMCLSLGDVAGKGLGAALFMAKLQATIRALIPSPLSLSEFGAKLNGIFCRDGLPNRFSSLLHICIKERSGVVQLLNAGHMPPLVSDGSDIRELSRGGPALGIMADAQYSEQSVELKMGEVLFVFSDGLTEAQNDRGDFFGENRLKKLLPRLVEFSAEEIGGHILRSVERFTGVRRPSDDLSLLILRRLPPGSAPEPSPATSPGS